MGCLGCCSCRCHSLLLETYRSVPAEEIRLGRASRAVARMPAAEPRPPLEADARASDPDPPPWSHFDVSSSRALTIMTRAPSTPGDCQERPFAGFHSRDLSCSMESRDGSVCSGPISGPVRSPLLLLRRGLLPRPLLYGALGVAESRNKGGHSGLAAFGRSPSRNEGCWTICLAGLSCGTYIGAEAGS